MSFLKILKNLLTQLYTYWCMVIFCIPIVLFYPFVPFFEKKLSRRIYVSWIEKIWAKFYFCFTGVYYHIERRTKLPKNQNYIYCANHTSLLDTVTMGLIARSVFVFIGKAELLKIPIFGRIFGSFHIAVDRKSKISAYKALKKSEEVLTQGYNLIIFPEGGIFSTLPPQMTPFKEGAFRLAIEKKVPIIPVTILHNWILLPDDSKHLLDLRSHWKPIVKAVVHPPIETAQLTLADLDKLKQQTFDIIDQELQKYYPRIEAMATKSVTS